MAWISSLLGSCDSFGTTGEHNAAGETTAGEGPCAWGWQHQTMRKVDNAAFFQLMQDDDDGTP